MNVAAYDKKEPIYYESTATWTLSQRIIQNIGIRLALEEINKIIPSAGIKKAHHVSSREHDVPFYLCNNQQIPHITLWIFHPAPVC